jgi:hypothetical protein
MSVQRSDRLTIRADGSVERAWSVEDSGPDPEQAQKLGDRFEALLQEDEPSRANDQRIALEALRRPMSSLPTSASADSLRGDRTKGSSTTQGPSDSSSDPSAQDATQGAAVQSKERKHDDRGGGDDSGGQGTAATTGAIMGAQAEGELPQPAGSSSPPTSTPEPTSRRLISEVASEVATRISASHEGDSSQVQIDLREDMMPQTSMTVEKQAGVVVVTVASGSQESASLVSEHAQELGQEISRRTGSATRISLGGRSWTTDSEQGPSTEGSSNGDGPDVR